MNGVDERIVIVGAGFAGVGLAIRLQQAGIEDFTILDRAATIGGTWRDNTYPGCACDVPSQLYSYSFAPNPDWSRSYGQQPEILAYLRAVAAEHGVPERVRFGTELRQLVLVRQRVLELERRRRLRRLRRWWRWWRWWWRWRWRWRWSRR